MSKPRIITKKCGHDWMTQILTFIHDLEMENFNLKEKIKNMVEKMVKER